MLLGKDETVPGICPVYRTDAVLRRVNADRYDDRLVVSANLVDSNGFLSDFRKSRLAVFYRFSGLYAGKSLGLDDGDFSTFD